MWNMSEKLSFYPWVSASLQYSGLFHMIYRFQIMSFSVLKTSAPDSLNHPTHGCQSGLGGPLLIAVGGNTMSGIAGQQWHMPWITLPTSPRTKYYILVCKLVCTWIAFLAPYKWSASNWRVGTKIQEVSSQNKSGLPSKMADIFKIHILLGQMPWAVHGLP